MNQWLEIQSEMDQIIFDVMALEDDLFVSSAKAAYEAGIEERAEGLFFSDYLCYDYKDVDDFTLLDKHIQNHPESPLSKITGMLFSVFEVKSYPAGFGLKDVFTKNDYLLKSEHELSEGDLLVARICTYENGFYLNEGYLTYPPSYRDTFVKGIMEKYNSYCQTYGVIDLERFLRTEPLLLMKFVEIMNEIETDTYESEEDYLVYQSVFLVGDPIETRALIQQSEEFDVTLDESGFMVARLYTDGGTEDENLVAEIVFDGNRIEIEALDETRQYMAKEKVKAVLGDLAVHFQDQVLSMDDLF